MLRTALHGFRDVAMLLARIAIGVILVARGWYRWQDTGVDAQAQILAALDLPAPVALAWLVIVFELAGGVLLVFGLGTPLVGLGMLVLNGGVILLRKLEAGLYHFDGGYEYNLALAALGLLFLAFGPGRLGIDYLFVAHRRPPEPPEVVPPPTPTEHTIFHRDSTGDS